MLAKELYPVARPGVVLRCRTYRIVTMPAMPFRGVPVQRCQLMSQHGLRCTRRRLEMQALQRDERPAVFDATVDHGRDTDRARKRQLAQAFDLRFEHIERAGRTRLDESVAAAGHV